MTCRLGLGTIKPISSPRIRPQSNAPVAELIPKILPVDVIATMTFVKPNSSRKSALGGAVASSPSSAAELAGFGGVGFRPEMNSTRTPFKVSAMLCRVHYYECRSAKN